MDLLVKYITGEASPEEAMAAEEWIQATPANKQQFEALQQLWLQTGTPVQVYQQPDVSEEWQVVKKSITRAKVKQIKPRRTSYMVAAAIMLLLGALGWFMLMQTTNKEEVTTITAEVVVEQQLPDQSLLILDGNSTVSYKEDFNKATRELTLSGEGFFKVTHDKQHPFIIDMEGVKLQVLGTSFRVKNDKETNTVHVDVVTGKVMLYNETDTLVLTAGQSGSYNRQSKRFARLDEVDVNAYSYATKQFAFSDTPLDQVAAYLEKTYKVSIHFQNPAIKACRLSAQFDQQPIEDILNVIASTFDIQYSVQGQAIFINGDGCK